MLLATCHEYDSATQEIVGTFEVSREALDIVYQSGPIKMGLLPPGTYGIHHVSGNFNGCGLAGMVVMWKSSVSQVWTSCQYSDDFTFEATSPHRIRLMPPAGFGGSVKVKVLRYVPKCWAGGA